MTPCDGCGNTHRQLRRLGTEALCHTCWDLELLLRKQRNSTIRGPLFDLPKWSLAETLKPEPNAIETFAIEMQEAAEMLREDAANEAAGRQGMMGPARSAGSLEGSPLFDNSQMKLF